MSELLVSAARATPSRCAPASGSPRSRTHPVVAPDPGVLPDSYLHYFTSPGQPIVYIQHSTEVPEGETVLTNDESYRLAVALDAVHSFFMPAYGESNDWYAMDVEWKVDDKYSTGTPEVFIKQARPFAGWSSDLTGACSGVE